MPPRHPDSDLRVLVQTFCASQPPQRRIAVAAVARVLEARRRRRSTGATRALDDDDGIGGEGGHERLEDVRERRVGQIVRRIDENEIVGSARALHERLGSRAVDTRGRASDRAGHPRCVALRDGGGPSGLLDEVDGGRPPALRLEPEGAGSGVQVQHASALDGAGGFERREQGLADAVARGARTRVRDVEGDRAGTTRDDACHRPTITVAQSPHAAEMDVGAPA
jgi:hypothetical protein